jgi:hypothetical protein
MAGYFMQKIKATKESKVSISQDSADYELGASLIGHHTGEHPSIETEEEQTLIGGIWRVLKNLAQESE